MEQVGRIRVSGAIEGSGFIVAPRLAVTANHVLRGRGADELVFEAGERSVAVERVDRAEDLDTALLHLAEDMPGGLCAASAATDAAWRVESRPRKNDPALTGRISATGWRITNAGGHDVA